MTIHSMKFQYGFPGEALMEQLNRFVKDEKLSRQDIVNIQFVYDDEDNLDKLVLFYAKEVSE